MSVLLKRIIWYSIADIGGTALPLDNSYNAPIDITDDIVFNSSKGLDIKNNTLTLTLKNTFGTYVDTNSKIKFSEQDQIYVYVKYVDNNDDITSAWNVNSTTLPSSDDSIGVFYITEFGIRHNNTGTQIQLTCVDKTYILFNRVFAYAYTGDDNKTAPQMIQDIIRHNCQISQGVYTGSGNNPNVNYDIDAKFVNDEGGGGYIQDRRPDNSVFPVRQMAKVWKPIYEWIKDLSQIDLTNSSAELTAQTYVCDKAFIFWVDKDNKFHWIYPSSTPTGTLTVGTSNIINVNMTKRIFDVVNMVIFNAGTDIKGTGIWSYVVDVTSSVATLKMRVMPFTEIARNLIAKDYEVGFNIASTRVDGGKGAGYPIPQFISAYGGGLSKCAFVPTTSYPTAGTITTNGKYNSALRERAIADGEAKANAILSKLANARWQGTVETKGTLTIGPGDLVTFTDIECGINAQLLRVMQTQHNINKGGWFTTLSLEEDEKAIGT